MNNFTKYPKKLNKKYKELLNYNKSIYSQNNEDGIIESVFEICGTDTKYCVDIGSTDGVWCSNVRNLIINYDWSALMIEGDGVHRFKKAYPELEKNYRDNLKVNTLHKIVTEKNIQGILDEYRVPRNFDLLSIDIDSEDLAVWRGIKDYKPKLVVIECNCDRTNLDDFYYVPGDVKGAAGVGSLNKLADEKGYDYLCVEMCNAFFIERGFGKPLLK